MDQVQVRIQAVDHQDDSKLRFITLIFEIRAKHKHLAHLRKVVIGKLLMRPSGLLAPFNEQIEQKPLINLFII